MGTMLQRSLCTMVREPGNLIRLLRTPCIVVMVAVLAAPVIASAADAGRRPNIVIILGHDLGFGFTLGYQINDSLSLTLGYKSTVNDSDPGKLQMGGFMVSIAAGWNKLVEGAGRLKGGK